MCKAAHVADLDGRAIAELPRDREVHHMCIWRLNRRILRPVDRRAAWTSCYRNTGKADGGSGWQQSRWNASETGDARCGGGGIRSEERRVGKEWRSRWA